MFGSWNRSSIWEKKVITFHCLETKRKEWEMRVFTNGKKIRWKMIPSPTSTTQEYISATFLVFVNTGKKN